MSKTKTNPDVCANCRYYSEYEEFDADDLEDDPDMTTGYCRRFPPVTIPGYISQTAFPEVSGSNGWCGEFTPVLREFLHEPIPK